jgi:hypothetical protein
MNVFNCLYYDVAVKLEWINKKRKIRDGKIRDGVDLLRFLEGKM